MKEMIKSSIKSLDTIIYKTDIEAQGFQNKGMYGDCHILSNEVDIFYLAKYDAIKEQYHLKTEIKFEPKE